MPGRLNTKCRPVYSGPGRDAHAISTLSAVLTAACSEAHPLGFVLFALTFSAFTLVAAAMAGNVFPALRSIRLLNEGRYADAETYLRGVIADADRASVRNAARYNLAVALHRQGRFAESLAELNVLPLGELDPSLHGAANALYGWNLIFLRRDLAQAERCIHASGPLASRATTRFALAYLHALRGEHTAAEGIIRAVTSQPPERKSVVGSGQGSALVIDRRFESIIEEHLLGLCALERGDVGLAQTHFLRVAHSGHPSFYPRHAAGLLGQVGHPLLMGQAA